MSASAPRYDARILRAVRALDDPAQPMAETCRRIGNLAAELGLARPSYVHLRRLVKAERLRALETAGLLDDVLADVLSGRAPRIDVVIARAREADARARLRRSQAGS